MSDFETSDQNWLHVTSGVSRLEPSLGSGVISHSLWGSSKADCSGRWMGWQFPPLKMMLFHFILICLFLVVILGKHPKLGVDLSVNILGLYHLKLEEGTTTTERCVCVCVYPNHRLSSSFDCVDLLCPIISGLCDLEGHRHCSLDKTQGRKEAETKMFSQ